MDIRRKDISGAIGALAMDRYKGGEHKRWTGCRSCRSTDERVRKFTESKGDLYV